MNIKKVYVSILVGALVLVGSFSGYQIAQATTGGGTATIADTTGTPGVETATTSVTAERAVSDVFTVVLTIPTGGMTLGASSPTFTIPTGFTAPDASPVANAGLVLADGNWSVVASGGGCTVDSSPVSSTTVASGQVITVDITADCAVGDTITLTYEGTSNVTMGATALTVSTADAGDTSPVTPLLAGSPTITVTGTVTVTYLAGPSGSITGSSTQTVNYGTNGSAVTAVPGVGQYFVDWSDASTTNPRTDTVTADVTYTANFATSTKDITAFSFSSPAISGTINQGTHTIAVTVPYGTNVTALVATFTTTGSSTSVGVTPQMSGTTANNFTNPVTYTVTAVDATTQNYVVTVTVAAAPVQNSGGGGGGYYYPTILISTSTSTSTPTTTSTTTPTSTNPLIYTSIFPGYSGYSFTRDLTIGNTGPDVVALQQILVNQGYLVMPVGVPMGYFGNLTRDAVIKYQLAKGITPAVGYFGPKTLSSIMNLITNIQPSSNAIRNLELNMTGEDVRQLQIYLNSKGFIVSLSGPGSKGNESDYFGEKTKAALIKFQLANGIKPAIGFYGPITRAFIKALSQ